MKWIIGMDEVGRGALAGPVYVGAVLGPYEAPYPVAGVRDSKKLSAKKREIVAGKLREAGVLHTLWRASAEEVDRQGINPATEACFEAAATDLLKKAHAAGIVVDAVFIDGNPMPRVTNYPNHDMQPVPVIYMVKGDDKVWAIGAASIIAKVTRDALMRELAKDFPGYGWEKGVGYGTPDHTNAIRETGLTAQHRKTFCKSFTTAHGT